MGCAKLRKNGLGTVDGIATMEVVSRLPQSCAWPAAVIVIAAAATALHAAEDAALYSARPVLAQVVLGGRTMPVELDPRGEAGGEAVYRALSLARADFPLEIGIATAPPGTPPVVRLRTRLEGWEEAWRDHECMMWLVPRFLDENNRAVNSASFTRAGESPSGSGWSARRCTASIGAATRR